MLNLRKRSIPTVNSNLNKTRPASNNLSRRAPYPSYLSNHTTIIGNKTVMFLTEHAKILIHPKEHGKTRSQSSLSQTNVNQLKFTVPNYAIVCTNTILDYTI